MAIAGLGLLCTLVAVPILYSAVERRSAEARAASSEERERMRSAAAMVMTDHPLGVGTNRFVAVANVGGYYARAGVAWSSGAALVHNTYYLVAAEMGVLGLLAFLGLLIAVFSLALNNLKRAPPGFGSEYAVGTTVMVLAVAAHSYYEWITMYYVIHVLFAMNLGVMVALRASLTSKKLASRPNRPERFEQPQTFPANA
jgi:O-antigen ligase